MRTRLAILMLVLASLLVIPGIASGAEAYTLGNSDCGGYSGQADERGYLYVPCNGVIRVYDPANNFVQNIAYGAVDVAPAADGSFVYVLGGWGAVPRRMVRGGDGVYRLDGWVPTRFFYAGAYRDAQASHIATDAWNNLYIASGYWTGSLLHTIIKYRPDASVAANFGTYTNGKDVRNAQGIVIEQGDPRLREIGTHYWGIAGITVSRDGQYVYVTEVGNNRVQRWDYQTNGGFKVGKVFGNTAANDPNRTGSCADGLMAAPYDIGIDPWGFVYVANATCSQVQKFTADGVFVYSSYVGDGGQGAPGPGVNHYIAVDGKGDVWITEKRKVLRRTTPVPGPRPAPTPLPVPDTVAPTLNAVNVPATTTTREIEFTINATDNDAAYPVAYQVRIAGEDGNFGAWKLYTNPILHTVSVNYGTKAVTVQLRDRAGNESAFKTVTLAYKAGDVTAPVLNAITIPVNTTTQQINVGIDAADAVGVTGYRIADENGAWGPWTAFAANVQHTLTAGYGVKGVKVQVRDAAGNGSNEIYKTLAYKAAVADPDPEPAPAPDPDPDPAPAPAPAPNQGADVADPVLVNATIPAATTTQAVTITIEATDDKAVTAVRFANEDGNWLAWRAFAAQSQHTLTANYGPKAVFVQVRDAAGRESNAKLIRTRYQQDAPVPAPAPGPDPAPGAPPAAPDTVAPVLNTLTLPVVTGTQAIVVKLGATDNVGITHVRFANEDGTWAAWKAFAAESQHTLTANFGGKAVFAQVRDAAGNESNTKLSRTSYQQNAPAPDEGGPAPVVDAADPVLNRVTIPANTTTRLVRLGVEATDDIGVRQVRFANEDGNWGAWVAFTPAIDHTLTANFGPKAVFVQVRDAAGRESNVVLIRTTFKAA